MSAPWFAPYEAAAERGAHMRVHTRGCSCLNCRFTGPDTSPVFAPETSTPGVGGNTPAPGVLSNNP
ncbi:hypothetical protein [Nocardia concava]|uniref:hypothetical protein n=1 Tax=Nocardia concava TaxID=257281 RepID=UPI001427A357|nr:hypothetical protein [Nocardia concava]